MHTIYSMGHDERETQFLENQANPLTACDYKQPPMVGPVPANDEIYSVASDERSSAFKKNVCDTLTHHDHFRSPVVNASYAVRRLMPIECERLQGLPDNYTFLPGEKSCSDSARYKALGNGMCQNCSDFVIRRIVEEVEKERTE